MTKVTVVFLTLTRHNGGMNIFQEALISVWFLTKLSIFGLTLVGAKVMWDKYGHHALSLKDGLIREDEEDEDSLSRWYG